MDSLLKNSPYRRFGRKDVRLPPLGRSGFVAYVGVIAGIASPLRIAGDIHRSSYIGENPFDQLLRPEQIATSPANPRLQALVAGRRLVECDREGVLDLVEVSHVVDELKLLSGVNKT